MDIRSRFPGWLSRCVNDEWNEAFGVVTRVYFLGGPDPSERDMANLPALFGLEALELYGIELTSEELKFVNALPTLTQLALDDTRIGDAGLRN